MTPRRKRCGALASLGVEQGLIANCTLLPCLVKDMIKGRRKKSQLQDDSFCWHDLCKLLGTDPFRFFLPGRLYWKNPPEPARKNKSLIQHKLCQAGGSAPARTM